MSLSISPAPRAAAFGEGRLHSHRLAAERFFEIGFEFGAHRFEIEGRRIQQALNCEPTQRSNQQRGLCVRLDVGANLPSLDALLNKAAHREPEIPIRSRHLGANFRHRPELNHAQRLAEANSGGEISLSLRSIADMETKDGPAAARRGDTIRIIKYGVKSGAYGVN